MKFYEQAIHFKPGRERTAEALLKEHFKRVQRDSGAEFGEVEFTSRYFGPELRILCAYAEIKKDFERPSTACSQEELAMMESMWSTLH